MTLKEKFETKYSIDTTKEAKVFASECEQIAEEFTCDFLCWFKNQVFLHCEWSVFDLSEKEILEIFKKEKGL